MEMEYKEEGLYVPEYEYWVEGNTGSGYTI